MGIELSFLGSAGSSSVSGAKAGTRGKGAASVGLDATGSSGFMAFLAQFDATALSAGDTSSGGSTDALGQPFAKGDDAPVVADEGSVPLAMDSSALLLQMQMSMSGAAPGLPVNANLPNAVSSGLATVEVSSSTLPAGGVAFPSASVSDLSLQGHPSVSGWPGLNREGADAVVGAADAPTATAATVSDVQGPAMPLSSIGGRQSVGVDVLPASPEPGLGHALSGSVGSAVAGELGASPAAQATTMPVSLAAVEVSPQPAVLKTLQHDTVFRDIPLNNAQGLSGNVAGDWHFSPGKQDNVAMGLEKPSQAAARPMLNVGGALRGSPDTGKDLSIPAGTVAVASWAEAVRQSGESVATERLPSPASNAATTVPTHRGDASAVAGFDPSLLAAKGVNDSTGVASPATGSTPEQYIAEQVSVWIGQNVQSAELRLDALGHDPVEVSIALSGNEAQVQFRSDAPETRELLSRAVADLNSALQREGLVLSGVSVGTSDQPKDNAREAGENTRATGNFRRQSDGLMASEGVPLAATPRRAQGAVDLFV